MIKKTLLFAPLSIALLISASSALADDSVQTLVSRAENAGSIVQNLAGANVPDQNSVPRALLADSVCIVTIPNYTKVGFVFGGSFGAGVAACRNASGQFETPFFVNLAGGSFGLQAGVESTDLMLVMTEANAQNQLVGTDGFKIGVEGSFAAGPYGRDVSAGTNVSFHEATLSYSTSRGIFAGATLNGSKLSWDGKAQAAIPAGEPISAALQAYQSELNALVNQP